jgi:hypothetical protein
VKASRVRDKGTVAHRHEANNSLQEPGDFVLVHRGVPRSLVMKCPDGCGEILTINLDSRVDKAWRFYRKGSQVSVFPSVWRDTGCGSHFIVWNQSIVWCDFPAIRFTVAVDNADLLAQRLLRIITQNWQHYTEFAQQLDEVPWDVQWVCSNLLKQQGKVEEGSGKMKGFFRKK